MSIYECIFLFMNVYFYSMLCMRHVFMNTGILEYMLQHTHILWWRRMAKPMLFYNIFIMFFIQQ